MTLEKPRKWRDKQIFSDYFFFETIKKRTTNIFYIIKNGGDI